MTQTLAKPITNGGRQIELDIVRGLAVFFMVLIHIQEYYSHMLLKESTLGTIIDFLGGIPAAPVFMFLMGTGVVYSKSNNLTKSIKRGFMLLLAGYVLNLTRGTLPTFLQWTIFMDPSSIELGINQLIYVDIFQFSGLALIVLGLIKHFQLKPMPILGMTLLFSALNALTQTFETSGVLARAMTGLFFGSSKITFFPFLSWIFYPLTGYLFGQSLQTCTNKTKFYAKWGTSAFFVIALLYGLFALYLEQDVGLSTDYSYYHHQLIGNLIFTAFVIYWISMFYFISKVMPNIIIETLKRWSNNVSEIYFIHWLLIGWLMPLLGYNHLILPTYFILVTIILISSDALATTYLQWRKK